MQNLKKNTKYRKIYILESFSFDLLENPAIRPLVKELNINLLIVYQNLFVAIAIICWFFSTYLFKLWTKQKRQCHGTEIRLFNFDSVKVDFQQTCWKVEGERRGVEKLRSLLFLIWGIMKRCCLKLWKYEWLELVVSDAREHRC